MKHFVSLLIFAILGCKSINKQGSNTVVNWNNPNISYEGRIDSLSLKSAKLHWPGSSIAINFKGKSIDALLKDNTGNSYYNVILDKDSIFIIRPNTLKKYYALAKDLKEGSHSIEIFKRTEPHYGVTNFYGFRINGRNNKVLPKSPAKKRKIEFYGNSITAGYAVEDVSGADAPESTYTNII